jgi:hypothetical protein
MIKQDKKQDLSANELYVVSGGAPCVGFQYKGCKPPYDFLGDFADIGTCRNYAGGYDSFSFNGVCYNK